MTLLEPVPGPRPRPRGFSTRQVHAGLDSRVSGERPRALPIHLTAGFEFDDFDQAAARFAGDDDGYSYTRIANPTTRAVERRIADLEGGVDALLVSSGQAAVHTALQALLAPGDRLLIAPSVYEGSRSLFLENFGRLGIATDEVDDPRDAAAWERAIRPTTRAIFVESIPNPRNDLTDLALVATVARRRGIPFVVDNTFATPYLLRPIEHGADVVVHSASKFLSGHGTVLGGVVVDGGSFDWAAHRASFPQFSAPSGALGGRSYLELAGRGAFLAYARSVIVPRTGPTPSPFNAFLLAQGIETLSLRVRRQSASALVIARWLAAHPAVAGVDYSGLPSSPHHDLALRYLPRGQGSVFSFTLHGGREAARRVVDRVRLFTRMTNLGDVRSLILHPASTTHILRTPAQRAAGGIDEGLLRLSIGVEDPDDLVDDLDRAIG